MTRTRLPLTPSQKMLYAHLVSNVDSIYAQRHRILLANRQPAELVVGLEFSDEDVKGAAFFGMPLVRGDVTEPLVRSDEDLLVNALTPNRVPGRDDNTADLIWAMGGHRPEARNRVTLG